MFTPKIKQTPSLIQFKNSLISEYFSNVIIYNEKKTPGAKGKLYAASCSYLGFNIPTQSKFAKTAETILNILMLNQKFTLCFQSVAF